MEFGATGWLLEMLACGGKKATASLVAAVVQYAKRWFERLERMLEGV